MSDVPYDALATLLVFLIGVPALIIQSMDPEIRRAVMKKPVELALRAGLPFLLAITIVIAATVNVGLTSSSPSASAPSSLTPPAATQITTGNLGPITSSASGLSWMPVLGLLLVLTIVAFAISIAYYGQRDRIVANLKQQVTRGPKRQARLNEKALATLIELGEQSAPGEDKELVLQALNELVFQVCKDPAYQGDSLETLITRLTDILICNAESGDSKNFRTAAGILQGVVMIPAAPNQRPVDLLHAVRSISTLSRLALTYIEHALERENILLNCVETLGRAANRYSEATTDVSQALFEIGIAAMEKKQVLVATAALNKLFTLVEANQPASGELVADTLGLASHFWAAGETARDYVEEKLNAAKSELADKWRTALRAAQKHCTITMQFETADNLGKMIAGLKR
jgi:hypothetical protein